MQFRLLLSFLLFSCLGCSSGLSQIATIQGEKEQLIDAIRQQKQELEDLRQRNEKLATQLNDAEIEIARGPAFGERRLASRALEASQGPAEKTPSSMLALPSAIADATTQPTEKNSAAAAGTNTADQGTTPLEPSVSEVASRLNWKPSRNESTPATENSPAGSADELKTWAAQKEWLAYDPLTQSVTVDLDLQFEKDGATLENDSKNQLDELADLLKKPAGKTLRVMVAGQSPRAGVASGGEAGERYTTARHLGSARALAVADYLDRHGIASDRLGVTAVAVDEKVDSSDASASDATRLSIHVLPGDRPVLGWSPPVDSIRR